MGDECHLRRHGGIFSVSGGDHNGIQPQGHCQCTNAAEGNAVGEGEGEKDPDSQDHTDQHTAEHGVTKLFQAFQEIAFSNSVIEAKGFSVILFATKTCKANNTRR